MVLLFRLDLPNKKARLFRRAIIRNDQNNFPKRLLFLIEVEGQSGESITQIFGNGEQQEREVADLAGVIAIAKQADRPEGVYLHVNQERRL